MIGIMDGQVEVELTGLRPRVTQGAVVDASGLAGWRLMILTLSAICSILLVR